jgi:hypothetical protein
MSARFVTTRALTISAEESMGSKPSNALKAKRPESGGTIEMDMQEKSRLMDADKAEFAQSQQEKNDAKRDAKSDANEADAEPSSASHKITGHEDELAG